MLGPLMAATEAEWVFFDVGMVLLIDEEYSLAMYAAILSASAGGTCAANPRAMMDRREHLVLTEHDTAPWERLGAEILDPENWGRTKGDVQRRFSESWDDFNVPAPQYTSALRSLATKYKLAMASNQPAGAHAGMTRFGICRYFDVLGISAEMGIGKPDRRFFEALLDKAGIAPQQAIMVGDRIDTDIAPAQALGLCTVQVKHEPKAWWFHQDSELTDLYLESLGVAPSRGCGIANLIFPQYRGQ